MIHGQTFLNGSFENNLVSNCMLNNITNSAFDSLMPDVKGIGLTQTIDIYYDTNCPIWGFAKDGHYYVSVENNSSDSTQSTIISLKLADTLEMGSAYSFCFYDRGLISGKGPVIIGISNSDSTFGTPIYTSQLTDTVWIMRTVSFISSVSARYITIKYGGYNGGAFIDNFGTCSGTGIKDEIVSKDNFKIYPNPTADQINIQANSNQKFNFSISNTLGQLVKSGVLETNNTIIYISELPNGIYNIELSAKGKIERKCFIVEKSCR